MRTAVDSRERRDQEGDAWCTSALLTNRVCDLDVSVSLSMK